MKKTITIILTFFFLNSFAQNNLDCNKSLLVKEIDIKMTNLEEFQKDFSKLKKCGLDSLDIKIFSNNSVLGSIFVSIISNSENEKITYGNLLEKLLEIKNTNDYLKLREVSLISDELSNKIAKIENWEEDKIKLKKLEVSEIEIEQIFNFIKENPNSKNYKEILVILNQKKKNNQKSEDCSELFTNVGNVNFSDLLKSANESKKPLMLYFSGYSCINSRKLEENLITENDICEKLKNKFYFVTLYVDDRKPLSDSEQFTSKVTNRLVKTIGQKNSNLQVEKFSANIQPFFVILNPKGEVIATESYSNSIDSYLDFINEGLKIK
jgi:thioredoxin-related protein